MDEIKAGRPTTSFPKTPEGSLHLGKEQEAAHSEGMSTKVVSQKMRLHEEPQVDQVRAKRKRYYEPNVTGHVKSNFKRMTLAQDYVEDSLC